MISDRATGVAKTGDGNGEAMRVLLVAKRSGRDSRIACLNQLRHLGFCAPDELRDQFAGVLKKHLAAQAAALRPRADSDPVLYATKLAMRTLGRRAVALSQDSDRLDTLLAELVTATAPGLLETASASTPPPSCLSPPATTRSASAPKRRGRTSVVSHRSPS